MEELKVYIYTNGTFDEEKALLINGKEVLKGDYYHNQIDTLIDGFILGLTFCGYEVERIEKTLNPKDELFEKIDFYSDESYDED